MHAKMHQITYLIFLIKQGKKADLVSRLEEDDNTNGEGDKKEEESEEEKKPKKGDFWNNICHNNRLF